MLIQLFVFPDCPGRPTAMESLRRFASESVRPVKIEECLIQTEADITGLDFHGSPTFLIEGKDLDETQRGLPPVFGCRLYSDRPAPSVEWITTNVEQHFRNPGA